MDWLNWWIVGAVGLAGLMIWITVKALATKDHTDRSHD